MGISLPYWDLLIFDDPLLHKWDLIFGNDIITLYWWKKHFLKWHLFLQIPDLYIVILDWYHIWLQETTITDDWYIYNKGFINQETSCWISYSIPKVKCFWTISLLCKINYIMQICWVEILTLHPKAHRRIPTVNLAFAYWSWTHSLKFSHVHDKVMLFFRLVPLRFWRGILTNCDNF